MSIEIIEGDLLTAFEQRKVDAIGHVVNCQGVMGSGIAKSIKDRYPKVYEYYRELFKEDEPKPGLLGFTQVINLKENDVKGVFNLFAQVDYGRESRHLNYGALSETLRNMANSDLIAKRIVGFPYLMGCDRAGGDWEVVLEMIGYYFVNHEVKIYRLPK